MSTGEFDFSRLDELYREVILDHYRSPRNRRPVEDPDIEREGFNPFCGDDVVLQLKLDGQGRVVDAGFHGQGCSISQASASMLTEVVRGRTLEEAEAIADRFRRLMHGEELSDEELDTLGELVALEGVKKFPIRIKCALLAWGTLEEGIEAFRRKHSRN